MVNFQADSDVACDPNAASLRSRASSVISTGTKISISTLPQDELQNTEANFPGRTLRGNARPHSLLSLVSHEQPAPPYDDRHATAGSRFSSYPYDTAALGNFTSPSADNFQPPPASPLMDSENALSIHYGRVVRTIDQNHVQEILRLTEAHEVELAAARDEIRRLTEEHQKELAATRHEIDQVYRQEFKSKNREVERIREEANTRVATFETELQRMITVHEETVLSMQQEASDQLASQVEAHAVATDKARNDIEDIWMTRWSDQTRLAREEAQRLDMENQHDIERAVADRDEEWVGELASRHPELWDELKDTIGELRARKWCRNSGRRA
ncbi:hypothetical protein MMC07_004656 [Pseudocyphellaria aurata]|nr:hypothetical protein [Pseudocyphellaria aurata]